ncbi:pyridoxal phosphate-dependent transferase [Elsinoe ampelina]|uniref:Pyridoxal phosphate-dependent transferase n=1 Tax=Elsinoe ampelina TaxID=302913 RepID=A0A6A6GI96_9PEZI|nr:pyridoxal phosphate-dependent transferase [Elsinoe ampelina]
MTPFTPIFTSSFCTSLVPLRALLARSRSRSLRSFNPAPYTKSRTFTFSPAVMATTNGISKDSIEAQAKHITNGDVKVNNWTHPGPAAFDFRSDVVTTPTSSMLAAIASTSLLDDVFQMDPTTLSLERFIADLTNKPAALLVLSGTMGNQVALRTHLLAPPHSVVTDHRSHIINWEAGGVSSLTGAMTIPVVPANGRYLTLEDIKKSAVVSDDIHACPTKVISLENTLNGIITPLAEMQRISAWAKEHGIIMHLDGARLWEAVASGAGSLIEYCDCFDSVSLCFSKGLGAPIGSIIIGTEKFRERARWVRKSIGGGLRQAGVVTAAARVAVEETFLGGKLKASHDMARRIEAMWTSYGGKLANPVETNMVWFDLEAAGISVEDFIKLGDKAGLRLLGGRLVVHYQVGEEAVQRLDKLMKAVLKGEELDGKVKYDPVSLAINVE